MKQHTNQFLARVNDAKKRIQETNVNDVKARMDNKESFVLVDVREDSEWQNGHLPGAIHLGKGIIERDIERTIPDPNTHIVLYCGGGYRSALAADAISQMGYTNVTSMDGGFSGWCERGYPVTEPDSK